MERTNEKLINLFENSNHNIESILDNEQVFNILNNAIFTIKFLGTTTRKFKLFEADNQIGDFCLLESDQKHPSLTTMGLLLKVESQIRPIKDKVTYHINLETVINIINHYYISNIGYVVFEYISDDGVKHRIGIDTIKLIKLYDKFKRDIVTYYPEDMDKSNSKFNKKLINFIKKTKEFYAFYYQIDMDRNNSAYTKIVIYAEAIDPYKIISSKVENILTQYFLEELSTNSLTFIDNAQKVFQFVLEKDATPLYIKRGIFK